jgi:hypothetical protein
VADTPTGLSVTDVRPLDHAARAMLDGWHVSVSGDVGGRLWLPGAVRRLSVEARLELARDDELDVLWRECERKRVEADVEYFIRSYGHVRHGSDDEPGPPIPFDLWDAQVAVLETFLAERRVAVLKARQLGLTWLALHVGFHLIAFDPAGASSTVLGLSQDGGYAKRLLERAREINDLLPPFLRQAEDRKTRESKTEFKLAGRGGFISLMGTPSAPRSHQADLAIADEWAHVRNGYAGPTMTALLSASGRIIAISSGKGGPDEPGDGQHFAQLYTRAREGANDFHAVFLATSTHPERDAAWREREMANYNTEEDFYQEHPETDDEALIGAGRDRFFPLGEIAAAVELGRQLDALLGTDEMPPPTGEEIYLAVDWGEATAIYAIWPLPGGGVYVPPFERGAQDGGGPDGDDLPALPSARGEPAMICDSAYRAVLELQEVDPKTGRLTPLIGENRYDAAGLQPMKTFQTRAGARYAHHHVGREVRSRKVPFGKFKSETALYMRRLFRRSRQGRALGYIAISPRNPELVRQLRALESTPDGLWKKKDDHGPDTLIAGIQRIARTHRELTEGGESDDERS